MKRGMTILSFTILLSLTLIASDPTRSTSAVAMDSGPSANGHYELFVEGGRQTVSFSARVGKDGTVDGTFQLKSRGQDAKVHGDIYCLYIEGNTAYLKGVITNGDFDGISLEGFDVLFKVQDNGEGVNSDPDLATDLGFWEPGANPTCDRTRSDLFLTHAVEKGNIQVKP